MSRVQVEAVRTTGGHTAAAAAVAAVLSSAAAQLLTLAPCCLSNSREGDVQVVTTSRDISGDLLGMQPAKSQSHERAATHTHRRVSHRDSPFFVAPFCACARSLCNCLGASVHLLGSPACGGASTEGASSPQTDQGAAEKYPRRAEEHARSQTRRRESRGGNKNESTGV